MIKLVRGDEESLSGRVVVYSKIKLEYAEKNSPIIRAVYASTSIDDLINYFDLSKNLIKHIKEDYDDALKKDAARMPKKKGNEQVYLYIYGNNFNDEKKILKTPWDILFTGDHPSLKFCDEAIDLGIKLYATKLNEQRFMSHHESTNILFMPVVYYPSEKSIKSYITKRFINPMFKYSGKNDTVYNRAKDDFLTFAAGKPYDIDALELCDLAKSKNIDQGLIQLYTDKIDALHMEDFKLAAELKIKIEKILNISK